MNEHRHRWRKKTLPSWLMGAGLLGMAYLAAYFLALYVGSDGDKIIEWVLIIAGVTLMSVLVGAIIVLETIHYRPPAMPPEETPPSDDASGSDK